MKTLTTSGTVDHATAHDAGSDLLRALFANSRDALVTVDAAGVITFATPAVASLLGFDSVALVGESVFDFMHPDDVEAAVDLFVRRLEFDGPDQGKAARLRNSSGHWTSVLATAALLPDARIGACAITLTPTGGDADDDRELSLQRRIVVAEYVNRLGADLMASSDSVAVIDRVEDALREVALLAGAEAAAVYIERHETRVVELVSEWQTSTTSGTMLTDLPRFERCVETLLSRHIAIDDLAELPSGHRDRCLTEMAEPDEPTALLAAPFSSGDQRGALVLLRTRRGPGWWESDSELVRGTANLVARALLTTWSDALLTLTYQLGPVGFSIRSFDGRFVDCNQRYLDLYGITREQAATISLFDVLLPEYHEPVLDLYEQVIAGELSRFVIEAEVFRGDGSRMWVRTNVVPMSVPGTTERYALTAIEDITEIQRQRIELEFAASHDPLTGVANRAAMCRAIERTAASTGELPGLMMIDLDEFKSVNDSHGHAAGDHVLQTVATRITDALRESDMVARLGGDEFAVVAPGLTVDNVGDLVARIRQSVSRPIEFDDITLTQTMSIGVAFGRDGRDLADLLVKADRALYLAKSDGRNCHRTFVSTTDPAST